MAASLNAQNGIRVFDVGRGYHPLPSETQYGASSYWVDFDRSGRLVTTSYDGFVRIYAAEHYDKPREHICRSNFRSITGDGYSVNSTSVVDAVSREMGAQCPRRQLVRRSAGI